MMHAAAREAAHPHIHAWQPAPGGAWCAVPSAEGARCFRKQGWRGFVAAVSGWAQARGLDAGALRVVSALPAAGALPPLPRLPAVLHVAREGPLAVTLTLEVPFELAIFQGHFPTVPIVPGAVLTGWAAAWACEHAGWPHAALVVPQVKFRRIVQPGYAVQLAFRRDAASQRLDFSYRSSGGLHSAGTLLGAAQ
jgi:3-hydroxymyristoyl/3-hydroxydecanoyl-(acyl carrier protein) dehydratase